MSFLITLHPQKEDFALGVINDAIFSKLVTIFCSVLDTSEIADNCIVVDRINAKSPAAELLIEAALKATASRPTIVAIDSTRRLQNKFRGETGDGPLSDSTQACLDTFAVVKQGAVPLGTDSPARCHHLPQLYDVEEFMEPWNFFDLPLPCPAEKAHINAEGNVPTRVKWQYHYMATYFGAGSHYIILDSPHDAPDLNALGQFSYIVANGQGMMYPRLKARIAAGESILMLHNTGGVTQVRLPKRPFSGVMCARACSLPASSDDIARAPRRACH